MDFVYRKAVLSDSGRIAELFEEMLRTIYHTNDVKGYEDGYLDRFFPGGGDLIYVAELEKEVVAFLSVEVYKEDGYICTNEASRYFARWTKSTTFCKSWEDSSNTKS